MAINKMPSDGDKKYFLKWALEQDIMFSSQIRLFENINTKAVSRGWEERARDQERLSKELSSGQTGGEVGSPQ